MKNTLVIYYPFEIQNIRRCYLLGDIEVFDDYVKIFFSRKLYETSKPKTFTVYNKTHWDEHNKKFSSLKSYIYLENKNNILNIIELKIQGQLKEISNYHIILIKYDYQRFSECDSAVTKGIGPYCDKSYFKILKNKISNEKRIIVSERSRIVTLCITIIFKLSDYISRFFPLAKYFNVVLHVHNFLQGLIWAAKQVEEKKKLDIKVMNLLLSALLDMMLGILFLNWLNSKISLDSFPTLFLMTAESVVNSLKDLINWLRGDPAGLKLNWAFNKVLATFFLFHIDIWWTFLAYLEPFVRVIFQIFLKLGLLGITFQASVTADLLTLVSFHIYCIYAYAAKLYSIQTSTLISLWRLFLGRKRNPLRGKVDSCRYSPEQLFVGTLAFTILLFLFPTTLLYYVVFTVIRLTILMMQAILMLIQKFNQALPVCSSILWLLRSPKLAIGIEISPQTIGSIKCNFTLLEVKPVTYSWLDTIQYFMPDCASKLIGFNVFDILRSLVIGKRIFPI